MYHVKLLLIDYKIVYNAFSNVYCECEKKENGGETAAPGHKLGKISDKPELAKSSPVLLGTGTRGEGQEDKLEKQSEVLRKRRRKTNKTGFPTTLKKKRRVEKEKTAQQQQWVS